MKPPPKTKPTKRDLIALLNWAAHEADSALSCYHNDRQPNRADALNDMVKPVIERLRAAASHFPPEDQSHWIQ